MARILGPKCRLCRREGVKLYLKGIRCNTVKCAIDRRETVPGQHGGRRSRPTDYGIHLREKQKCKRYYGLGERQFKRTYAEALRMPGNTGENLLALLERRLDNVTHRLGFAASRAAARQLISHGHVTVNGRRCNIPSAWLRPGDVVKPYGNDRSKRLVAESLKASNRDAMPTWLKVTSDEPAEGTVLQNPSREDVGISIQEQLIVEFASR